MRSSEFIDALHHSFKSIYCAPGAVDGEVGVKIGRFTYKWRGGIRLFPIIPIKFIKEAEYSNLSSLSESELFTELTLLAQFGPTT